MVEFDRQDILDKAAEAYDHAESTIRAMDSVFQNVTGSSYDAELTLAQFDMILQASCCLSLSLTVFSHLWNRTS
jgi:hypothetical protein